MKLRMHENSLFAVLLRSPWWISLAIAVGLFVVARMFVPDLYAAAVPVPFAVIGAIAAWRQLQLPSAARVAQVGESVRAMAWPEFSAAVQEGLRGEGYSVSPIDSPVADFLAIKGGKVVLVACKRWRIAQVGIESLRELHAARDRHDAHECIYIAVGKITDNARKFATEKKIRLMQDAELARLLPRRS